MTLNTGRLIRKGANASIDKMAWGEEESICCSARFALGDKLIG